MTHKIVALRMGKSLHSDLKKEARVQGITISAFVRREIIKGLKASSFKREMDAASHQSALKSFESCPDPDLELANALKKWRDAT